MRCFLFPLFLLCSSQLGSGQGVGRLKTVAHEEHEAKQWLIANDFRIIQLKRSYSIHGWNYETNMTQINKDLRKKGFLNHARELRKIDAELDNFPHVVYFEDPDVKRQIRLLRRIREAVLPDAEFQEFTELVTEMEFHKCNCTQQFTEDPEIDARLWKEWYDKKTKPKKAPFKRYLELKALATRLKADSSPFSNPWSEWLEPFEDPTIEKQLTEQIEKIRPLYRQLHAFVRHKLDDYLGPPVTSKRGPIPLHIVGNVLGQVFKSPDDLFVPYPENYRSDEVSEKMKYQNYTQTTLFQVAERFFGSLGMTKLPGKFWENSIFQRPKDGRQMECQPSSWDFFQEDDVRVSICSQISKSHLILAHSGMANLYNFLHYKRQPAAYRQDNAFSYVVGDTLGLAVNTPKYFSRLGLVEENRMDEKEVVNRLMDSALEYVVFLFYAWPTDLFRKEMFLNKSVVENNCRYWELREKYGGVEPPVQRSKSDFDVVASQIVSGDTDYVSIAAGIIFHYQLHKGLCEKAGQYEAGNPEKSLQNCDIYGSVEAGKALQKLMSLGASRPWPDALEIVTGQRTIDVAPMLEYYQPLFEWLVKTNKKNKTFVGWSASKRCGDGRRSKG